jgi:hypothetical protein
VTPIAERPSRVRPNTASNTASTTTTSRPMSATKTRLMGQYASLGKLAMATPRGGKENVGSNIPGSARKRPTTPRDLYDYNGRRIDPNGPRKAFTPRSANRPNRRAFDEDDEDEEEDVRYEGRRPATARRDEGRETLVRSSQPAQRRARVQPRGRPPRRRVWSTTATAGGSRGTGDWRGTSNGGTTKAGPGRARPRRFFERLDGAALASRRTEAFIAAGYRREQTQAEHVVGE